MESTYNRCSRIIGASAPAENAGDRHGLFDELLVGHLPRIFDEPSLRIRVEQPYEILMNVDVNDRTHLTRASRHRKSNC
jgi:hypothetical protein